MSASKIDGIVGNRLRERREELGISQGRLGRHLGLTFSQIQKYEKGSNRIGAGRLYLISEFLGVSPTYFFEAVDDAATSGAVRQLAPPRDELRALIDSFAAIEDPDTRRSVVALVRSLTVSGQAAGIPR